jgi:hypothetical protein
MHYFTPESKQSSMEWHHKGSPPHKKFKTVISWRGHAKCVFEVRRVIHVDFPPHVITVTINAEITITCFEMMCTK